MKDDPLYLTSNNRHKVYYYRRPISLEDQAFWRGPTGKPKSEWNKSLGTKDRREAIDRLPDAAAEFDAERNRQIAASLQNAAPPSARETEEAEAQARIVAARKARQADPERRKARVLWRERLQLTTEQMPPETAAVVDLIREGKGDSEQLAEANKLMEAEIAQLRAQLGKVSPGGGHTVDELIDAYEKDKAARWSASTAKAVKPVFRVIRDLFAERTVGSISREDARETVALLEVLPTQIGKRPQLAGLTVREAIEKGRKLGLPTIKPKTINDGYIIHLAAIFAWAVKEQWISSSPFLGLSVHDPVKDDERRDPFAIEQLQTLFSGDLWRAPWAQGNAKAGDFWVPLLCLFHGLRNGEVAGLRPQDFGEQGGVPFIDICEYQGRSLKTAGSRATMPLHPVLVELGFPAFADAQKRAGEALLFPDGKPNSRGQWGAKLGERFSARVKALDLKGTRLGMHSFRHNFEDALRAAELPERTALALARRAEAGSGKSYGDGVSIQQKAEALSKVAYPGLDLSHLRPAS